MKKIMMFSITISLFTGLLTSAISPDRKEARQEQYNNIVKLIENGDFIFEARRAYPQAGRPVDLTTSEGHIIFLRGKGWYHFFRRTGKY